MKYLLLNSLKCGGAEKVAQTLASSGLFDRVIILEKDCDYEVSIPLYILSKHSYRTSSVFKTLFIPLYALRLSHLLKKDDVVVSFAERANFVNIVASYISSHKTIITIHTNLGQAFKAGLKRFYLFLIKLLYPKAKAIVSVSNGIQSNLNRLVDYKGINRVIYNPLDIEKITLAYNEVLAPSWSFLADYPVLITTGRLAEEKDQEGLLRVFKCVVEKNPRTKLVVIGTGELEGSLHRTAQDLGLRISVKGDELDESANVFFLGYQSNPYMFYKLADTFILSSFLEGLSMVIIEAMACGLPVISSDCDFGPRELLSPGTSLAENIIYPFFSDNGLLLPVLKKDESFDSVWVDSIISMLSDRKRLAAFKEAGRKRAEYFSLREIVGEWRDLFEEIK